MLLKMWDVTLCGYASISRRLECMKMTVLRSFETSGNTSATTRRHLSERLLESSNRRTLQSHRITRNAHGKRLDVACVAFACTSCPRLDLASTRLHMWFSPSVTLAERQREEETLADCRTYSVLITNCQLMKPLNAQC